MIQKNKFLMLNLSMKNLKNVNYFYFYKQNLNNY